MKRATLHNVLLLAGVAALAGGVYLGVRWAVAPAPVEEDEEPEVDLPAGVRFHTVASAVRDVYQTFPGIVSAEGETPVRAPVGMRLPVEKVVKDEGDFVEKDDVVIRFSEQACRREIEKARKLGRDDLVKVGEEWLQHLELKSPAAGVVKDIWRIEGEIPVDVGIPMFTIVDRDGFRFRATLPQALTKTVAHIGANLTVELEGTNGKVDGVVTGYDGAAQDTVVAVVGLEPKEGLEDGMKGLLRLPASTVEVAIVPKAAVHEREGVKVVRVWETSDGSIAERTIRADGDEGADWIVVAGVYPGDAVVVPDDFDER